MRAALIPPIPHLNEYGHGSFHLLLAHLIKRSPYRTHYRKERKLNSYLVLDNSAHEKGTGEDAEDLLTCAGAVNAQEIVVPDVLDNADATIEACLSAHEVWYEKKNSLMAMHDPALMYVPQGQTKEDWVRCMHELVRIHLYCSRRYSLKRDLVLGLSKDYEVWPGGLLDLIENHIIPLKRDLAQKGLKMPLHLLGWGRDLWQLNEIAKRHDWIRSTDSAKPFVYALSDIQLVYGKTPVYPTRPRGYFGKRMTHDQCQISTANSLLFLKAAAGEL